MHDDNEAIDRAFARFCSTGEPDALGEVFDGTAARLLRVALWLCGNRADAEDALQRTFLMAIEARRRFEPGRKALPWLLGVLGNQVCKQRRERSRRAPAREVPAEDPVVQAATAELQEAIAHVNERLGDAYRSVLTLHLQQGLAAHEIAARLRRPAGTVRTQLVRALEALRERLPRGFLAGTAPLWLPDGGSVPLVSLRDSVLAAARTRTAAALAGVGSPRRLASAWRAATVGAIALGVSAIWWSLFPHAPGAPATTATSAAAAPATMVATRADVHADDAAGSSRNVVATGATVTVRLLWADDDTPAAGQVATCGTGSHPLREQRAVSDGAGRCEFARVTPGTVIAACEGRDRARFPVAAGEHRDVTLHCPRGLQVHGTVVDARGAGVAGASIVASRLAMSRPPIAVAATDATGRFSVRVPPDTDLHAIAVGHAPSLARLVTGTAGENMRCDLQLRGAGGALAVAVRTRNGCPMPFAQVLVECDVVPSGSGDLDVSEPPARRAVADADGHVLLKGLRPGDANVHAWAIGCAPARVATLVPSDGDGMVEVALDAGGAVAGTVSEADGTPARYAWVRIEPNATPWDLFVSCDEEGRYCFDSLAPGMTALSAGAFREGARARGAAGAELRITAGAVAAWDPVLDRGRCVSGRVVDAQGRGIARVPVGWRLQGRRLSEGLVQTDDDGSFELAMMPDATVEVAAYGKAFSVLAVQTDVRAPCGDLLLVVDDSHTPDASLRGRVVDADGMPVRCEVVVNDVFVRNAPDGTFAQDGLPAGDYPLVVRLAPDRTVPWRRAALRPHEVLDLGTLALQPPCTLLVRAVAPDGTNVPRGVASLATVDGLPAARASIANGIARFADLQPGRYRLDCTGTTAEAHADVEVAPPGIEATVRLAVHVLCKVRCTAPAAAAPDARATLVVAATGDQPERRIEVPITDDVHAGANVFLPLGRQTLRATAGASWVGELTIDVAAPSFGERMIAVAIPLQPTNR